MLVITKKPHKNTVTGSLPEIAVSEVSFAGSLTLSEGPQGHTLSHNTGVLALVMQGHSVGLREAQPQ